MEKEINAKQRNRWACWISVFRASHTHTDRTHTSLPGLRLRQLGWNLLTWRTWIAHLMLRWCSWLVTFRYNKSFWDRKKRRRFQKGYLTCMPPHTHRKTHHREVLQHLSVHSALVKLVFVLRKSDVIEPTCGTKPPPSETLTGSPLMRRFALSTYEWPRCNPALRTSLAACWRSSWWQVEVFSDGVDFLAPTPGEARGSKWRISQINEFFSAAYSNWQHRFIARQKESSRWTVWRPWRQN